MIIVIDNNNNNIDKVYKAQISFSRYIQGALQINFNYQI